MITQQPSGAVAQTGDLVTMSVVATGTGSLGYQWYKDGQPLADGNGYSGATSPALSIYPVQALSAGDYHAMITMNVG